MTNPADSMPFAKMIGIKITETAKERVIGNLKVTADHCTVGEILHGGAIMAFADTLGAMAGYLNLPKGAQGTTTIESKTNFLAGAKLGDVITGEAEALSVGKKLSVWQVTVRRPTGKLVAVVTQTQLVLQ